MIINKNIFKLLIILIVSLIVLFGALIFDSDVQRRLGRKTLDVDQEFIDGASGILYFIPADENDGLISDIFSTIFDENEYDQYLILPDNYDAPKTVLYAMTSDGVYLKRYVYSLTPGETISIGNRNITAVSTELPVLSISIDKDSPSFDALIASDKSVVCHGIMSFSTNADGIPEDDRADGLSKKTDDITVSDTIILQGRGNTSWGDSPKKSFTLKLDKKPYLPGLGMQKSYNLISNSQDKALLNNEVFLRMSDRAGIHYEPRYEQITLYIDGKYQGVYLITTKIKVRKGAIELNNGDFLMNWGEPEPAQPLFYDTKMWMDEALHLKPYVNIVWPEGENDDKLAHDLSLIQRFISSVEDTGSNECFDHMDMDNMARYYWIQEISMNYDADYRSAYSYYRADTDKIYMGPVWDMDRTLGLNADKGGIDYNDPTGWKIRDLSWYKYLFDREEFRDCIYDVYWNGGIRDAMFDSYDYYKDRAVEMADDGYLNYRRWRSDWPDLAIRYGDSYDEEAAGKLNFFKQRMEWIDLKMKDKNTLKEY